MGAYPAGPDLVGRAEACTVTERWARAARPYGTVRGGQARGGPKRGERRGRDGREFEAFVAGAGGRLLHAAALLTGEPPAAAPAAERLLLAALAHVRADWDRLPGGDPYACARRRLVDHFARTAWRHRRPRGGLLAELPPRERLTLVLRLYEGMADEQAAAVLGLPVERVRALCSRGMAAALSRLAAPGPAGGPYAPRGLDASAAVEAPGEAGSPA